MRVRFADLQESSAQVTLAPGAITQDFSLEAAFFETITVGSPFGMNGRFVYTRVSFTF